MISAIYIFDFGGNFHGNDGWVKCGIVFVVSSRDLFHGQYSFVAVGGGNDDDDDVGTAVVVVVVVVWCVGVGDTAVVELLLAVVVVVVMVGLLP
jgi:hypothetical protein